MNQWRRLRAVALWLTICVLACVTTGGALCLLLGRGGSTGGAMTMLSSGCVCSRLAVVLVAVLPWWALVAVAVQRGLTKLKAAPVGVRD